MSVKSCPIYWLECDVPECRKKSTDGSDFLGLVELEGILLEASESDWFILEHGDGQSSHYCFDHWAWCDRCEDEKVPLTGPEPRYCDKCWIELKSEEPVDEPRKM